MTSCCHPETFNSLCVVCGQLVDRTSSSAGKAGTKSIVVNGNVLTVSATEHDAGATKLLSLQRARRLVLVLDIDHTLLHSVQIDGPAPRGKDAVLRGGDVHHLPIEERDPQGALKHLVMKKRPYLDLFLEEAHKFCEMTIYTAGTRRYAEAVVKAIDPTGKYIGKRIVSRTDALPGQRADFLHKSLDKAFMQESALAVILDDREDVWRGKQNEQLLLVRAYQYFFPGTAAAREVTGGGGPVSEVNNAPGSGTAMVEGLALADCPPSPVIRLYGRPGEIVKFANGFSPEYTEEDDQLLRSLEVLKSLHENYYRDWDERERERVKEEQANRASCNSSASVPSSSSSSVSASLHISRHLNALKCSLLRGYTLCFSGLIPTNESRPEAHVLWRLAVSLGASVSHDVLPHGRTTHLLAIQPNTRKVAQCLSDPLRRDTWVVHPDWLVYCRWAMAHVAEAAFMLVPRQPEEALPNPQPCYESTSYNVISKDTEAVPGKKRARERDSETDDIQDKTENDSNSEDGGPKAAKQPRHSKSERERETTVTEAMSDVRVSVDEGEDVFEEVYEGESEAEDDDNDDCRLFNPEGPPSRARERPREESLAFDPADYSEEILHRSRLDSEGEGESPLLFYTGDSASDSEGPPPPPLGASAVSVRYDDEDESVDGGRDGERVRESDSDDDNFASCSLLIQSRTRKFDDEGLEEEGERDDCNESWYFDGKE